jgi:putative flippase GtrA
VGEIILYWLGSALAGTSRSLLSSVEESEPSFLGKALKHEASRQMLKFMSVGFVNLTLSVIIFRFSTDHLVNVIQDVNLRLLAGNTVAFAVTVSTAFLMNSRFTFKGRTGDAKAYARYGAVNIVGWGLNSGLLILFSHFTALLRHETVNHMVTNTPMLSTLAYLMAVGCVFFWNFFMSRHWVFPVQHLDG